MKFNKKHRRGLHQYEDSEADLLVTQLKEKGSLSIGSATTEQADIDYDPETSLCKDGPTQTSVKSLFRGEKPQPYLARVQSQHGHKKIRKKMKIIKRN